MTIDDALIPVVLPSERALIACGVAWRGVYLITCNFEWGVRDHKFTLFRAPNEAADRRVPGASVAVEIQGLVFRFALEAAIHAGSRSREQRRLKQFVLLASSLSE